MAKAAKTAKKAKAAPVDDARLPKFVSTSDLANMLGVTEVYVRRVSDAGFFSKASRGRFELVAAVRGYIGWLKDEDRRSSKSAAASRVQDVRSREIELRIEEREKRHLLEAQAEAISVIDEFGGKAKSELLALPARLTADLAMRKRFTDGIDAAFGAAAEAAIAAADLLPAAGSSLAALRKPDTGPMGGRKPRLPTKRGRSGTA